MVYEEFFHKRYKGSGKASDTPLSYYMNHALKSALQKKSHVECKLMTDWLLIVGIKYASSCHPLKIIFPSKYKNDGVLHIVAYHGSAALQLQYSQPIILEKITSYFGYRAIATLVIHQKVQANKPYFNPVKQKSPQHLTEQQKHAMLAPYQFENITDEGLREALARLAVLVHCKNSSKKN